MDGPLVKEFIDGRNGSKSDQDEKIVKQVNEFIGPNHTFIDFARQKCRNLYLQIYYQVCSIQHNEKLEKNFINSYLREKILYGMIFHHGKMKEILDQSDYPMI